MSEKQNFFCHLYLCHCHRLCRRCRLSFGGRHCSKLESFADVGIVLKCGKENAVAATKSVVEQALFCQALSEAAELGVDEPLPLQQRTASLAAAIERALAAAVPSAVVAAMANSPVLYWAGPNDGVAEELTLKTNEITRKRSHFLEGTYAVHVSEMFCVCLFCFVLFCLFVVRAVTVLFLGR